MNSIVLSNVEVQIKNYNNFELTIKILEKLPNIIQLCTNFPITISTFINYE